MAEVIFLSNIIPHLPPHSEATPQISSFAPEICFFLWQHGRLCTISKWPPHWGHQLWIEKQMPYLILHANIIKITDQVGHGYLYRRAPLFWRRISWSGCCHSSTPESSAVRPALIGPEYWTQPGEVHSAIGKTVMNMVILSHSIYIYKKKSHK